VRARKAKGGGQHKLGKGSPKKPFNGEAAEVASGGGVPTTMRSTTGGVDAIQLEGDTRVLAFE
jgi:hypothetical protein